MKNILIITGRYLPGYKDGGPVRTIKNLTDILGNKYLFKILTSDRDHGDTVTYESINVNTWTKVGNALVFYCKNEKIKFRYIINCLSDTDIVYCCGPYNIYTIKCLILKKFRILKQPLVIASMGSFSKGALSIKSKKKSLFLNIFKILGLFKNVVWSTTSKIEQQQLYDYLGVNCRSIIAEDLPRRDNVNHLRKKNKNEIRIIFLSRICKIKNLIGVIDIISKLKMDNIIFDIYGNIEDKSYWNECMEKLRILPSNIIWEYKGVCSSENVVHVFTQYDIFLFPTFGENFGHVISESLIAGCIPIISDCTPWNDLEQYNCGNVLKNNELDKFVNCVEYYYSLNSDDMRKHIDCAKKYIESKNYEAVKETGYIKIFNLEN